MVKRLQERADYLTQQMGIRPSPAKQMERTAILAGIDALQHHVAVHSECSTWRLPHRERPADGTSTQQIDKTDLDILTTVMGKGFSDRYECAVCGKEFVGGSIGRQLFDEHGEEAGHNYGLPKAYSAQVGSSEPEQSPNPNSKTGGRMSNDAWGGCNCEQCAAGRAAVARVLGQRKQCPVCGSREVMHNAGCPHPREYRLQNARKGVSE